MRIRLLFILLASSFLLPCAEAQTLPKRDLTVELRQIEEGREEGGSSYRAGPSDAAPLLTPQKIQVRNGEKGVLRMNVSVPLQWVESVQAGSSHSGAGVKQALQWFDVGQTLSVTPRWPGGNRDAVVEVDVQQADMATRNNAELPGQSRSQLTSTVTAPLAQWVTIAASGAGAARQGSYSSEGGSSVRRLVQIRVMVP